MLSNLLVCLSLVVGFADEPQTGALLQTLPEDGVWSKFEVMVKIDNRELQTTWVASSVGKAFHDGKECRFVELEQMESGPEFAHTIWRLLVAESEFGADKHPLSKAVKIWHKTKDAEAKLITELKEVDPVFASFVSGPETDRKREAEKSKLVWQRGELECEVITGLSEARIGTAKIELRHRVLRDKSLPFGFAGAHETLKIEGQPVVITAKFMLVDHGNKAEAKLPLLTP